MSMEEQVYQALILRSIFGRREEFRAGPVTRQVEALSELRWCMRIEFRRYLECADPAFAWVSHQERLREEGP